MVSKLGALGALLEHGRVQREGHLALGAPDDAAREDGGQRPVDDRGGLAHRLQLAGVLHLAQRLHEPGRGLQHDALQHRRQPRVARERQALGLDPGGPLAGHRRERGRDVAEQVAAPDDDLDPPRLLPGGDRVAGVGHQLPSPRPDEGDAVRADVAGQVAHVGEVGDDQRAEPPLGERLHDRVLAGDLPHESSSRRRSRASRYPSGPRPQIAAAAMSRTTDWRRCGSRASTSDRCTSTNGAPSSSSASRIDHW